MVTLRFGPRKLLCFLRAEPPYSSPMHHGLIAVEQPRFHPVTFAGGVRTCKRVRTCMRVTTRLPPPILLFSEIIQRSRLEEIKEETRACDPLYRMHVTNHV